MELKQLTDKVYYIPNAANIGVIADKDTAILIDSGLDDDAARKILRLLDSNGLKVTAIVNTHSHADHCGGNRHIKATTGAQIYAPALEAEIISCPSLEPLYLSSGAKPLKELNNKFLMAPPCKVDAIIADGPLRIGGIELVVISLPGHTPGQIGIAFDDILFCGDAVFGEETLQRHKIPFYTDIDATRATLGKLRELRYRIYVPAHGMPVESLATSIDTTIRLLDETERSVLAEAGKSTERIVQAVCQQAGMNSTSLQQHYLNTTVILAYLSMLHNKGALQATVSDNSIVWKTRQ